MSSLTEYESSIRRHVQLALMQGGIKVSRVRQLAGLLLQAMLMVRDFTPYMVQELTHL
jgi:hypothetical protein